MYKPNRKALNRTKRGANSLAPLLILYGLSQHAEDTFHRQRLFPTNKPPTAALHSRLSHLRLPTL